MGGKSSPKAPDYGPMAQASEAAARYAAEQAYREHEFAARQYEEMKPLLFEIGNAQVAAQNQQMRQAADYYDYMKETYRPLEQGMVKDAQEFSTKAHQEKLATQAAADAGRAFTATKQMSDRRLASMGVNPNSGKFAATDRAGSLMLAAKRADAMTDTRTKADQLGWAKRLDAAGLGRGLAGASAAAYAGATRAGNSAAGNYMAPGAQYQAAMHNATATGMAGYNTQMQGLGAMLGAQSSIYGADRDYAGAGLTGLGSLAGMLGGAAIRRDSGQSGDRAV